MTSWKRAISMYRTHLGVERNLSPNTLRAYLADVAQFEQFLHPHSDSNSDSNSNPGPGPDPQEVGQSIALPSTR